MATLHRTVREARRAAARIGLKRYAPPKGPRRLVVQVEEADGASRVVYRG
ncbi:MAG: hypothetical protein JSS35_14380 [Proteobacteria bacterium]|nr:hypothetical protein [Pseudomonadota bacterium]